MALTWESFTEGVGSANDTATVAVPSCAAGDTIVAVWQWHGTQTITSATCSGETVAQVGSIQSNAAPDNPRYQWLVIHNVAGSGTKTITCVLSALPTTGSHTVRAWRLSGAETAGANDGNPVSAGGNSTAPTVNITTTVSPAAVFSVGVGNGGDASGYQAGFTSQALANNTWYDFGQYDISIGSPATYAAGFTIPSANWFTSALAIKESGAVAGGGGKPANYYSNMA